MSGMNPENEFEPETVNQLLSALSEEHNRFVLRYFRESSANVASLDEFVEKLASEGTETGPGSRERIATRLHHMELPKLADAGVIDYDPRSKTVRCRNHPVLEYSERHEVA